MKRRLRPESERGELTIEAILMMPVLLLMVFAVVQLSVIWFANGVMENAATDALFEYQTTRIAASGTEFIEADLRAVLKGTPTIVTTIDGGGFVRVVATGYVQGPFPGSQVKVEAVAVGPIDGFRPKGDPTQ